MKLISTKKPAAFCLAALLTASLFSGSALAASDLLGTVAPAGDPKVATGNQIPAVKESKVQYSFKQDKITEITQDDRGNWSILVGTMENGMRFVVKGDMGVLNVKDNKNLKLSELKAGMTLVAVYPSNCPLGMSLPPMNSSSIFLAVVEEGTQGQLSFFNEKFISQENTLELLNLDGGEVKIRDLDGTVLKAEDLKNRQALVFYGASTRSIPAQTTPFTVLRLPEIKVEAEMVALRPTAEKAGFQVQWLSSNQTITLTKANSPVSFTLTLGSDTYGYNKSIFKLAQAPELRSGLTFVPSTLFDKITELMAEAQ